MDTQEARDLLKSYAAHRFRDIEYEKKQAILKEEARLARIRHEVLIL